MLWSPSMGAAQRLPFDPTYYPESDEMGENVLHLLIRELFRRSLASFMQARKARVFVGSEQFLYYRQYAPTESVCPDTYVLPGVPPKTLFRSWKLWERKVKPSFALEIVSRDPPKDYLHAPRKYQELGVEELVIFDPEYMESSERAQWQVFRRTRKGRLELVVGTNDDRVRSKVLRCWLRSVGEGADMRIRLATGKKGDRLVPLPEEEVERLRARLRKLAPRRRPRQN